MSKRPEILAEARRWIGTPVLHRHAVLGFGVDCWTLVRAVGEACGVLHVEPDDWQEFARYGEQPSPRVVLGMAGAFLASLGPTEPQAGDVACIAWRPGLPMHFAIRGDFRGRATLIHAHDGRVVEHGFSQEWPSLVHNWWRFPGVVD